MTTFTRRELYELIWSKPMRDAAAEIGISDVGLKKVCVRHRVPVPPQGYWNKVHAGRLVRKTLFHAIADPAIDQIEIRGAPDLLLPEPIREARQAAVTRERAPERKIEVADAAAPSHPKAIKAAAILRKAKPDDGFVSCSGDGLISVHISPANVDRAIRILDSLYAAIDDRGYSLSAGPGAGKLLVDGETIGFGLSEKLDRVPHRTEPERKEKRPSPATDWLSRLGPSRQEWDYVPSGRLVLALDEQHHTGLRRRWVDGSTQRIEDLLNDFMAGAVAYAAAEKHRRQQQEEWRRKWAEAEQQRLDREREQVLEEARATFVAERLADFEQAEALGRYLDKVRDLVGKDGGSATLRAYVAWAEEHAAYLRSTSTGDLLEEEVIEAGLFAER